MTTRLVSLFTAVLLGTASLHAAGSDWLDNLATAKEQAAKDKKDILIEFTGSDWCPPCKMLHEEVFSKDAFLKVGKNEFVLMTVDFPKEKEQSPELKARNEALEKQYGVDGYPTVILADAMGRPYATTGYEEGGAEAYLAHLATLRDAKKSRDDAFAKAAGAEGMEKAKLLAEGLAKIDQGWHAEFYKTEIDALLAADKDDTLGFAKKAKAGAQIKDFEDRIEAVAPQIETAIQNKDFNAAGKIIDDVIAAAGYTGEAKQRALAVKIGFFAMQQDHTGAMKLVDEIIAVEPQSETATMIGQLKPRIQAAIDQAKAGDGAGPAPVAPEEKAPDKKPAEGQ